MVVSLGICFEAGREMAVGVGSGFLPAFICGVGILPFAVVAGFCGLCLWEGSKRA